MTVLQFTHNSTGKYALVANDNIVGQAYIFNNVADLLVTVNSSLNYTLEATGANYLLKGKAGRNYLSSITISGTSVNAIGWSTSQGAALTTNDINQAISIAQTISLNF